MLAFLVIKTNTILVSLNALAKVNMGSHVYRYCFSQYLTDAKSDGNNQLVGWNLVELAIFYNYNYIITYGKEELCAHREPEEVYRNYGHKESR